MCDVVLIPKQDHTISMAFCIAASSGIDGLSMPGLRLLRIIRLLKEIQDDIQSIPNSVRIKQAIRHSIIHHWPDFMSKFDAYCCALAGDPAGTGDRSESG
jgi:hypothetical protein